MNFDDSQYCKISIFNLTFFLFVACSSYSQPNRNIFAFNATGTLIVYSFEEQDSGKIIKKALSFRLLKIARKKYILLSEISKNICHGAKFSGLELISLIPMENRIILIVNSSRLRITVNDQDVSNRLFTRLFLGDILCISFLNEKAKIIVEYKDIIKP